MKKAIAVILVLLICCFGCTVVYAAEGETSDNTTQVSEDTSEATESTDTAETSATQAEIIQELKAPVIQFASEPTNSAVSVTVMSQDSIGENGKVYYQIGQGEWQEYTEAFLVTENIAVSAKVVNGDSVQSPITTVEITCIDKTAPSVPTIVADNTSWTSKPVTVSITDGVDNESGFLRNEYKLGAEGEWVEYYGVFSVSAPTVVYARTVDKAMNYSQEVSINIANFDTTAPDVSSVTVTFGNDKGAINYGMSTFSSFFTGYVTCSVDGASDSQSGVAYYEYQLVESSAYINEAAWKAYDPEVKPTFTSDFIGYVYVRAYDNAGNCSAPIPSAGVVLDSTAPVITNVEKSTSRITDQNITVTFKVSDNISLDYVTVNDNYVGIYAPSFVAFRNGEYTIVAADKAGNTSTYSVLIDNIQTTPYNTLKIAESLTESEYTPSSWNTMQKYAAELRSLLAVETNQNIINSASEQLTDALEALVRRGDGTYALELIERVESIDRNLYTTSSWMQVDGAIAELRQVLENSESSQLDIDTKRAGLETAVTNMVLVANFTALDRIINTIEGIDGSQYPQDRYQLLMDAVANAKALDRADTDQATADKAYSELLNLMGELNINEIPEEEEKPDYIYLLIIGVAVLSAGLAVAIILIIKKANAQPEDRTERNTDKAYYYEAPQKRKPAPKPAEAAAEPQTDYSPAAEQKTNNTHTSFGDIHFGDEGEYNDWE